MNKDNECKNPNDESNHLLKTLMGSDCPQMDLPPLLPRNSAPPFACPDLSPRTPAEPPTEVPDWPGFQEPWTASKDFAPPPPKPPPGPENPPTPLPNRVVGGE